MYQQRAGLLAIANRDGAHAYCKHDGSLEEGFEIVTHPMSLDYHLTKMPWLRYAARPISLGYLEATRPGPAACMST